MTESQLKHLQLMDTFKERLDRFIRAQVECVTFDRAQYDINISKEEDGASRYTINLQLTGYGQQVIQIVTRDKGFSIHVDVVEKGKKTLPQYLISMFHENLLGEQLDNSVPEGNESGHPPLK